jgi:hypothetical protein
MQPSNDEAALLAGPGRHLYFDDRAAVAWYRRLEPGLAEAVASSRRVLIVVGRRDCGGTRALIEKIFPKQEITEELRAGFVCICADVHDPEPAIRTLIGQASRPEPTPLCLYTDAAGRLLHSTVGGRPAAVFLRDLTEAQARK